MRSVFTTVTRAGSCPQYATHGHAAMARSTGLLVGNMHADAPRRVNESLHVLPEVEDGRTLFCFVHADALESPGAVMERVREHMYLCIRPRNEFSVPPNVFCCLHVR